MDDYKQMTFHRFFSLVNMQAKMNLKAEASRFVLSYLWWVIEPMLFVLVFYFVFEVLLDSGRGDFLLFLVCGKIPFMWFSKSVIAASSSILQNKGLIQQIDVPKTLFPYVAVHQALYKQWAVFILLVLFVMFFGHYPSFIWLTLIPLIFVQYLLILCCSLIAALVVCYVKDVQMLISMGMMFLMFSSGIFWDVNALADPSKRELLLIYNPVAFIIDAYRQVLMYDAPYDFAHTLILGGGILILLLTVQFLIHKKSKVIAAKIIS